MKKFAVTLALLACFANQAIYAQDGPTEEELESYRLDPKPTPQSYEILLKMEEDVTTKVLKDTFTGTVKITLNEDADTIKLHRSKETEITKVTFCTNPPLDTEKLTYNDKTEIMSIDVKELSCPERMLLIEYKGKLYGDMYGFYKSTFTDDEKKNHIIATTQFQPTYARRAFPCFDEPSFKATFDITIEHPDGYIALSNQPDKTPTLECVKEFCTAFEKTPPMSTYLVAFVVGKTSSLESVQVDDDPTHTDPKMAIYAPKHLKETMTEAEGVSRKILQSLEKITGIKYSEMSTGTTEKKMTQLNQIAIPDFAAGAMENWGLVTYRETALLHDSKDSTWRDEQRIASVIAHEFAHMWFGNLVTLKWWSSTWLNEGFARYFEYHAINELKPDWKMADQFVIEQMHSIFQQDVTGALALTSDVYTPSGVKAKFGSISYNKGACIIRMLERALFVDGCKNTECEFEKGINTYLKENKYKNTEPANLFDKFSTPKGSVLENRVKDFMAKWTNQTGYPVVYVSIVNKKLVFEQKQFKYASDDKSNNKWLIPISYYFDKDTSKSATPKLLLEGDKNSTKEDLTEEQLQSFVVVNVDQIGYYRVHYSKELMKKLEVGLKSGGINEINRAQIVDDTFNLARVGKVDYSDAFNTLSFLNKEESYFAWYAAFNGFSYLRRRLPEGELKNNVTGVLNDTMATVYSKVKLDNSATDQIEMYKKVLVLQWACEINLGTCRADAMKMFIEREGKPATTPARAEVTTTPANLRNIVYCEAARNSSENWEKVWKLFKETTSAAKKVTIITALGCSNDTKILKEYLTKSITPESGIRSQDANSVFTAVMKGSQAGVSVALDFLTVNYAKIREHYHSMNALSTVITAVADRITTLEQGTKFKTFLTENEDKLDDAKDIIPAAIATVDANRQWVETYTEVLMKEFGYDAGGAGNHIISLSLSALLFLALSINYLS